VAARAASADSYVLATRTVTEINLIFDKPRKKNPTLTEFFLFLTRYTMASVYDEDGHLTHSTVVLMLFIVLILKAIQTYRHFFLKSSDDGVRNKPQATPWAWVRAGIDVCLEMSSVQPELPVQIT
jgi:hypothetical protein